MASLIAHRRSTLRASVLAGSLVRRTLSSSTASVDDGHRITKVGAAVNGGLALAKGVAGYAAGSSALVADAGHSLSDLFSDACTLWALDQARRPATSVHPYGRGKYEAVGASATAAMVVSTGLGIGFHAATSLYDIILSAPPQVDPVTMSIAGAAACVGVLAKEWLYRETMRIGVEIRSPALIANAWHHRSDACTRPRDSNPRAVAEPQPCLPIMKADRESHLRISS